MVSERLKGTILKALQLESFEIHEATTAGMVPGWDSLSHIRVIMAVEDEFGVRFRTVELLSLRNVGDLQALIDRQTMK